MGRTAFALIGLLAIALAPLGFAQEDPPPEEDIDVIPPERIDVEDGAEEATVAGLSTTVVIILIVLAVLVVALIVAMASRP